MRAVSPNRTHRHEHMTKPLSNIAQDCQSWGSPPTESTSSELPTLQFPTILVSPQLRLSSGLNRTIFGKKTFILSRRKGDCVKRLVSYSFARTFNMILLYTRIIYEYQNGSMPFLWILVKLATDKWWMCLVAIVQSVNYNNQIRDNFWPKILTEFWWLKPAFYYQSFSIGAVTNRQINTILLHIEIPTTRSRVYHSDNVSHCHSHFLHMKYKRS